MKINITCPACDSEISTGYYLMHVSSDAKIISCPHCELRIGPEKLAVERGLIYLLCLLIFIAIAMWAIHHVFVVSELSKLGFLSILMFGVLWLTFPIMLRLVVKEEGLCEDCGGKIQQLDAGKGRCEKCGLTFKESTIREDADVREGGEKIKWYWVKMVPSGLFVWKFLQGIIEVIRGLDSPGELYQLLVGHFIILPLIFALIGLIVGALIDGGLYLKAKRLKGVKR